MRRSGAIRWLPLAVLAAGLVAFFALGLQRYVSFRSLAEHREWLGQTVAHHRAASLLAFVASYALAAAFSLPGAALLSVAGGFLFGTLPGAVAIVFGATMGATLLFVAAKHAIGAGLRSRAGTFVARLAGGFRRNALGYLLFLRLVPLFPFWLVNLVPALLGVSLRTFVLGTAIGIIPGTLVYASLGAGLGTLLDRGQAPNFQVVFTPRILFPMLALGLLALVPAAYARLAGRAPGTRAQEQLRG